jgi:hypothetical protein
MRAGWKYFKKTLYCSECEQLTLTPASRKNDLHVLLKSATSCACMASDKRSCHAASSLPCSYTRRPCAASSKCETGSIQAAATPQGPSGKQSAHTSGRVLGVQEAAGA